MQPSAAVHVRKQPLNVHFYLTPVCNLQCTHCYYDAWWVDRVADKLLPPAQVADVITTLCDRYEADFHVEGGEAFLRKDLGAILRLVPHSFLSSITLTTSGTVPVDVDPALLRPLGDLRVSVEGHTDALQHMVRGTGLTRALRTCDEFLERGIPFTVRVTLFRENFTRVREMIDFFAGRGYERLSFYEFQAVGRGTSARDDLSLGHDNLTTVFSALSETPLPPGVSLLKLSLNSNRVPQAEAARTALEACGFEFVSLAGLPNLTINHDGEIGVSPWRVTADRVADRIGRLGDTDLADVVATHLAAGTLNQGCHHTSEVMVRYRRPN